MNLREAMLAGSAEHHIHPMMQYTGKQLKCFDNVWEYLAGKSSDKPNHYARVHVYAEIEDWFRLPFIKYILEHKLSSTHHSMAAKEILL